MTVLWEKYVALSVETSFFQSLFFSNIKKRNMKAIRFFHLPDGFHKLELCIGLNPFFFIFNLVFRFGVLRYVFLGPYLRFLSLWGNSLCSRWSVLSFCFFFRFLLLSLLYQFSHRLSTLYFDFFICFPFLFCLLLRNYFYFQIIIIKYPCRTRFKTNPAGIFSRFLFIS